MAYSLINNGDTGLSVRTTLNQVLTDANSGTFNGTSGTSGTSGVDGINGTDGVNGTSGTSGTSGVDGINGTDGVNGTSGTSGTSGVSGTDGAGVAAGGTTGQVLAKVDNTDYNTEWIDAGGGGGTTVPLDEINTSTLRLGTNAGDLVGTNTNSVFVGYDTGLNTATLTGNGIVNVGSGIVLEPSISNNENVSIGSSLNRVSFFSQIIGSQIGKDEFNTPTTGYMRNTVAIGRQINTQGANIFGSVLLGQNIHNATNEALNDMILIGTRAGKEIRAADRNVCIGYQAGFNDIRNTCGNDNVYIGTEAGDNAITSGIKSVFIGYRAGFNSTAGSHNVGLGSQALYFTTGSDNIQINAGSIDRTRIRGGSNNIALGNANSGLYLYNGNNNIVIGDSFQTTLDQDRNNLILIGSNYNAASNDNITVIGHPTTTDTILQGPGNGIVLTTPDGNNQYKISVDNSGNIISTLV